MSQKISSLDSKSQITRCKRPRIQQASTEEFEALTAAIVGLPPWSLLPAEESLLSSEDNQQTYIIVRNHILTRWRKNPKRYLDVQTAAHGIRSKCAQYASVAFRFLDHYGYINFGALTKSGLRRCHGPSRKKCVIVIGAGLAGLAAARQLRMKGHRVIVLEGRHRIGGRVHSEFSTIHDKTVVMELGGSIINGIEGNPLALIASQRKLPMHRISEEAPLYLPDGTEVSTTLDKECEKMYNALLDRCGKVREKLGPAGQFISLGTALDLAWKDTKMSCSPQHRMLINWHFANLEFANANRLEDLSLKEWDQDDPYELPGAHVFLPSGNCQIIDAIAKGTKILLNQIVRRIQYASNGVEIRTDTTFYRGDVALVTVPLGVLKKGCITFDPPLSARKMNAIENLGYGRLNKVVMWFPQCFWKEKGDIFGYVNRQEKNRGKYFLFYSNAYISGGSVLTALVSGRSAELMESQDDSKITNEVMQVLSNIFNPDGIRGRSSHIASPLKVCCTRWGQDPFSYGSYSSVAAGPGGSENYDILAENLGHRVFFAGEATSRKYPATMHGAFLTGLREAANISATLQQL